MADCAAAMGVEAVITWDGFVRRFLRRGSIHPYLRQLHREGLARRVVTTVEYRGLRDVDREMSRNPTPTGSTACWWLAA